MGYGNMGSLLSGGICLSRHDAIQVEFEVCRYGGMKQSHSVRCRYFVVDGREVQKISIRFD